MHFICNFPMKNMTFLHQAVAPSKKHGGGIFRRFGPLARVQDGGETAVGLMWALYKRRKCLCSAEEFNAAEVNNAWCSLKD